MKVKRIIVVALLTVFVFIASLNSINNFSYAATDSATPESTNPADQKSALASEVTTFEPIKSTYDIGENFWPAAENDDLVMFIHLNREDLTQSTVNVAVLEKKTGKVWYSTPKDADLDPIVSPGNRNRMKSHLMVSYYNRFGQKQEKDSFSQSVQYGQIAVSNIVEDSKNTGVRIVYTVGKVDRTRLIPNCMDQTKFEAILDKLTNELDQKSLADEVKKRYRFLDPEKLQNEQEKQTLLVRYPSLAEQNIYQLRTGLQEFILDKVENAFTLAGYTFEEMYVDNMLDTQEAAVSDKEIFIIPVEFRIEGKEIVAQMHMNEIEYEKTFPIYQIKFLEFFGAGGVDDEGYMFVPDGSGALIYLNNGKTSDNYSYLNKIYGLDKSLKQTMQFEQYDQCFLPIFGMKHGNNGFLAVVEEGETVAEIAADISGKLFSYNQICTQYTLLNKSTIDMPNLTGLNTINIYQPKIVQSKAKIRFILLDGDKADYVGMAEAYREYLLERGQLKKISFKENQPLTVDFIGAVDTVKTVVGMPMTVTEPLTSYSQAKELIQKFESLGMDNLIVKYTGWYNKGYNHDVPDKVKVESSLGGKKDFTDLVNYINGKNFCFYSDATFEYCYNNRMVDSFGLRGDSIRFLNKTTGVIYDTNLATLFNNSDNPKYIISPHSYSKYVDGYMSSLKKLNVTGISARTLGSDLNSDFNVKKSLDRGQALDIVVDQFEKMQDNGFKVMVNGGNAYTLGYTDYIMGIPLQSNRFNICDESIPFYQIVVHGYVDYSGMPVNLSLNYTENLLRTVETGASLQVKMIYEDNSLLKDTNYNYLYSVNYSIWLERTVNEYNKINEAMKELQDKTITGHAKIAENVYMTAYENGTKVYVNYGKTQYSKSGVTVAPQNFTVVK